MGDGPSGTLLAYSSDDGGKSPTLEPIVEQSVASDRHSHRIGGVAFSQWAQASESNPEVTAIAPDQPKSATADSTPQAPAFWQRPDRYHLAVGFRLSVGAAGFDSELASIDEGYARYQWDYGLGLQASFLVMQDGNNEGLPFLTIDALTVGPAWHPLKGFWFDPFMEAHLVGVVDIRGGYPDLAAWYREKAGRLGAEGILGLQLASDVVAGGLHIRYGTIGSWLMLGAQVEVRL